MGRFRGTSTSMLRGASGWQRMRPARSRLQPSDGGRGDAETTLDVSFGRRSQVDADRLHHLAEIDAAAADLALPNSRNDSRPQEASALSCCSRQRRSSLSKGVRLHLWPCPTITNVAKASPRPSGISMRYDIRSPRVDRTNGPAQGGTKAGGPAGRGRFQVHPISLPARTFAASPIAKSGFH